MPILIPIRSGSVKTVIPETPGIYPVVPVLPLPEPPQHKFYNDAKKVIYQCPAGYFGNAGEGFVAAFTISRYSKEEANAAALAEATTYAQTNAVCVLGSPPYTIFLVITGGLTLKVIPLNNVTITGTKYAGSNAVGDANITFANGYWQGFVEETGDWNGDLLTKKGVSNINNAFGVYNGETYGEIYSIDTSHPA